MFYPPFITNKTNQFGFNSGCVVRVKMVKCIASYSQGKAILSVYIAAKDVLAALYY